MSDFEKLPGFSEILKVPSVTSVDPNERKLARRLRIQWRQDILAKRGVTEDEEIIEKTPTEKQILASTDVLEKLEIEGDEVVTCVKIANDAREVQRRKEERDVKKKLLEKLEIENQECMKHYQEINDKWTDILASNDPLDMHTEMKVQNEKCLEVLAKKDAVIAQLKQELKQADLLYEEDQKKQDEDISILIERIENQMNIMSKAYNHELLLIDNVIDTGRKALLTNVATKWETLYKKLREGSNKGIQSRKELMKEYEDEMEKLMIKYQEEFRTQKIKLELENQRIQQEVQYMKALCLLNTEKLDYSYSVLKLREDENSIIKGQQKRRINKLHDIVNKLKKDYADLEESSRLQIQKLTDQVLKIHKDILELQRKSDHFTQVNEKKYLQIWEMNVNNAKKLTDEILNADKQICEEMLGVKWQRPENILLTKEDLPSYRTMAAQILKDEIDNEKGKNLGEPIQTPCSIKKDINLEGSLLKHMLRQISVQSGFLIEDGLRELLVPYTANDNIIIRLDNVFRALGITSEAHIDYLLNFFLPYTFCPNCISLQERETEARNESVTLVEPSTSFGENLTDKEEFTLEETKLISAVKQETDSEKTYGKEDICWMSASLESSKTAIGNSHYNAKSLPIQRSISSDILDDDSMQQHRIVCERGHLLQIRTSYVTRALKEFVESYHSIVCKNIAIPAGSRLLESNMKIYSRALTVGDISRFWQSYRDIFPEKREKVWDALLVGLQKYYGILKERHQLSGQIQKLRRQNGELRRLLKSCSINIT